MKLMQHGVMVLGLSTAVATSSVSRSQQALFQIDAKIDRYLIELAPGETRWIREDEKWALRKVCVDIGHIVTYIVDFICTETLSLQLLTLSDKDGINFMDITNTQDLGALQALRIRQETSVKFPKTPAYNDSLTPLLEELKSGNMHKNLEKFTSFYTRYYKSTYGAESSAWLYNKVNETIHHSGAAKYGAHVKTFEHPWGQSSIIATIPGRSEKTVVIGAHQDSINLLLPSLLSAPGADDDGSGTVTILEALRVLLQSDAIIQGNASNTIEFQWYSAEEGGLLGSQAIFSAYEKQGRDVKAMLQQDMTGYTHKTLEAGEPESVGVITDFVNPALTEFIKQIITQYCSIPYVLTKCGMLLHREDPAVY